MLVARTRATVSPGAARARVKAAKVNGTARVEGLGERMQECAPVGICTSSLTYRLSLTHAHTGAAASHSTGGTTTDTYSLAACVSLIGSSVPRDNENDENFWIDRKLRRSREVVDRNYSCFIQK